mgnify:CR=1 FL=1
MNTENQLEANSIRNDYSPYPNYKQIDGKWLNQIPKHWDSARLKHISKIIMGQSPPSEKYNQLGDGVPFLQGNADFGNINPIPQTYCIEPNRTCLEGDVLLSVRAPVGEINIAEQVYGIGRGLCAIRSQNRIRKEFLWYLCHEAKLYLESVSTGSTYDAVSIDDVKSILFALPPIKEQDKIAEFLNNRTINIGKLIDKQKRLIVLLEEKRTALISRAVTKGLDPDVEMKDSGVEWLGEIPKHWGIKPLFSLMEEQEIKNEGNKVNQVLSLSYGKIVERDVESNFGLLPESFDTYQIIKPGNIILRLMDLQNDKRSLRVGLVKDLGIITSAYLCLKVKREIQEGYAYKLLHSYDVNKVFYAMGGGVRQTMRYDDLKHMPVLIPPENEQTEILEYISEQEARISTIINVSERLVSTLSEYRSSIISHVVTGKIDVRN